MVTKCPIMEEGASYIAVNGEFWCNARRSYDDPSTWLLDDEQGETHHFTDAGLLVVRIAGGNFGQFNEHRLVHKVDAPAAALAKDNEPLTQQVGGEHYKGMAVQPVEFIHRNGLGFIEGAVVKYVSRWRSKGGLQDIDKAIHFLQLLKQLEQGKPAKDVSN